MDKNCNNLHEYPTYKKNINLENVEGLSYFIYGIGSKTATNIISGIPWENINYVVSSSINIKNAYMLYALYNTGETELIKKLDINITPKKILLLINGINKSIVNIIIKNRPYKVISDVFAKKNGISDINEKIIRFVYATYCVVCENSTLVDKNINKPIDKNINKIPHTLRTLVWKTYASNIYLSSKCYCCRNNVISIDNFMCGHIESRLDGGSLDLDNLRPICNSCNTSMGSMNMNIFIKKYKLWQDDINQSNKCLIAFIEQLKNKTIEQNNDERDKVIIIYGKHQIDLFINKIITDFIRDMYFDIMKYVRNNIVYIFDGYVSLIEYKETKYIHSWLTQNNTFTEKKELGILNPITNIGINGLISYKIKICDYSVCFVNINIRHNNETPIIYL